jgi:hypothetical protein
MVRMKNLWILILLLICTAASAQSALLGKRLIAVGEDAARVREAGGEPERVDKIPGEENQAPMEIWTYTRKGRQITVWLVNDKVVQLEDKRAEASKKD